MMEKYSNLKQLAFWMRQKYQVNPNYTVGDVINDIENENVPISDVVPKDIADSGYKIANGNFDADITAHMVHTGDLT